MKQSIQQLFSRFATSSKWQVIVAITGFVITITLVLAYSGGAAGFGWAVTGAPFNSNQTCGRCHGGGNFGGQLITRLYTPDSTQVTAYQPGKQYFFVINLRKNSGTPQYGFQTTCATTTGQVNVNRWGVNLPVNVANRVLSGRNYVEHTTRLASDVDTIIIPWRGPVAGTGSVTFWTAANFVDGFGGTGGDQVKNNSLTIPEQTAAMPALEIREQGGGIYSIKLYQLSGTNRLLFHNAGPAQKVYITYTNNAGQIIYTNTAQVNAGDNIWPLEKKLQNGIIHINVVTESKHCVNLRVMQ